MYSRPGQIGVYKGTIVAVKFINKRSVDLTRSIRKELKLVSLLQLMYAHVQMSLMDSLRIVIELYEGKTVKPALDMSKLHYCKILMTSSSRFRMSSSIRLVNLPLTLYFCPI